MTRSMALLIGIVALLVSCSHPGALLSISKNPVHNATEVDYLSWKTGPSGDYCAAPEYTSSSEFIRNFSSYSDNIPFPVVSWASEARRKGGEPDSVVLDVTCLKLPGNNSWAETLKQIGDWVGAYNTVIHHGFVEIAWADKKDEVQIRNSMKEWVPPIVFRSRYAADYLAMWHAISGVEFRYDPALITKALEYDKERLLEESDPDLPMKTESPEWPFSLGFLNFTISERMKTSDFMPILAAHIGGMGRLTPDGWIIEGFQRNEQGLNVIKTCLNRLKTYEGDWQDIETLSRIGTFALPELIREFKIKHADLNIEYERKLIAVLSRISSPERDEALVAALSDFVAGKRSLGSNNLSLIMQALMPSNCRTAIPILEQIAENKRLLHETRSDAKITLYALGRLIPHEGEVSISVAPKAKAALQTELGKNVMQLLRAVLVQTDQYEPGMEISSIQEADSVIKVSGHYAHISKVGGGWGLTIPMMRPDRALITFGYVCGQLCGQGYSGKMKKLNGRWTIVRWQKTWMS